MMGETCPYSHGVFEVNLHPCKYRTEFCRDGPNCTRSVCFFAHHQHELRKPLTDCCPTPEEFAAAEGVRAQQVKAALAPNSAIQGMIDTALQDAIPQLHSAGGAVAQGAGDRQAIALRQLSAQQSFRPNPARRPPPPQRQMSTPVPHVLPGQQYDSLSDRFLSLDLDHLSLQSQWPATSQSLLSRGTYPTDSAFAVGPLWAAQADGPIDTTLIQQLCTTGRAASGDASSTSGFTTPAPFLGTQDALLPVALPNASEPA